MLCRVFWWWWWHGWTNNRYQQEKPGWTKSFQLAGTYHTSEITVPAGLEILQPLAPGEPAEGKGKWNLTLDTNNIHLTWRQKPIGPISKTLEKGILWNTSMAKTRRLLSTCRISDNPDRVGRQLRGLEHGQDSTTNTGLYDLKHHWEWLSWE